jgi:hypothetical protein
MGLVEVVVLLVVIALPLGALLLLVRLLGRGRRG